MRPTCENGRSGRSAARASRPGRSCSSSSRRCSWPSRFRSCFGSAARRRLRQLPRTATRPVSDRPSAIRSNDSARCARPTSSRSSSPRRPVSIFRSGSRSRFRSRSRSRSPCSFEACSGTSETPGPWPELGGRAVAAAAAGDRGCAVAGGDARAARARPRPRRPPAPPRRPSRLGSPRRRRQPVCRWSRSSSALPLAVWLMTPPEHRRVSAFASTVSVVDRAAGRFRRVAGRRPAVAPRARRTRDRSAARSGFPIPVRSRRAWAPVDPVWRSRGRFPVSVVALAAGGLLGFRLAHGHVRRRARERPIAAASCGRCSPASALTAAINVPVVLNVPHQGSPRLFAPTWLVISGWWADRASAASAEAATVGRCGGRLRCRGAPVAELERVGPHREREVHRVGVQADRRRDLRRRTRRALRGDQRAVVEHGSPRRLRGPRVHLLLGGSGGALLLHRRDGPRSRWPASSGTIPAQAWAKWITSSRSPNSWRPGERMGERPIAADVTRRRPDRRPRVDGRVPRLDRCGTSGRPRSSSWIRAGPRPWPDRSTGSTRLGLSITHMRSEEIGHRRGDEPRTGTGANAVRRNHP